MANTKFPFILNGVKFNVNPTNIAVEKPLVRGELPTQSGVRFQIWYDQPEVVTITGIAAGETAYSELLNLKTHFERTTSTRISTLYYKTKVYRGFINNLSVGHGIQEHLRFPYQIDFQLLQGEQFNIHDLSLEPRGIIGEAQDFLEENINAPIARAERALGAVFGKVI